MSNKINAVMVSHNAPEFAELAVRSLIANHCPPLNMQLTVFDNASTLDTSSLEVFLHENGIPFLQSGFNTKTKYCSHGEIMQAYVREHPDCDYYLFLDHDICFYHKNVIHKLLDDIEKAGDAVFSINPREAGWYGEVRDPADNPKRVDPFCALIKNTDLFRRVVAEFGFGQFNYEYANSLVHWETFELMTKAMRLYGLKDIISEAGVIHFRSVSFSGNQRKLHLPRCLELLDEFRNASN